MKITDKMIRAATVFAVVAVCGVIAQDDGRVLVSDVGLRAGARGLIFIIDGAGPMRVDTPPTPTAQYIELRVTVNNGRVEGGRQVFTPPAELPLREIVVEETQGGLLITAKTRGVTNGPVELRGVGTNQIRILMTRDPQPEVAWSALKGLAGAPTGAAAPAGDIRAEPVDMKRMEDRAVRDAQAPAGGDMFSVKGAPQGTRQRPAAQAATAGTPQIAQRRETPSAETEAGAAAGEVVRTSPEGELVRYRVYGRDPFVPLVKDTSETELPRVENLRLVGVLEDARERIALVEDFKNGNRAFALRANDPVEHGKVLRVQRDRVVFLVRDFDVSRSWTLGMSPTTR